MTYPRIGQADPVAEQLTATATMYERQALGFQGTPQGYALQVQAQQARAQLQNYLLGRRLAPLTAEAARCLEGYRTLARNSWNEPLALYALHKLIRNTPGFSTMAAVGQPSLPPTAVQVYMQQLMAEIRQRIAQLPALGAEYGNC